MSCFVCKWYSAAEFRTNQLVWRFKQFHSLIWLRKEQIQDGYTNE